MIIRSTEDNKNLQGVEVVWDVTEREKMKRTKCQTIWGEWERRDGSIQERVHPGRPKVVLVKDVRLIKDVRRNYSSSSKEGEM